MSGAPRSCFRPGGLSLTEHALELCDLPPNALALDVGCGAGGTLGFLQTRGVSAVGVDVSLAALKTAREHSPRLAVAQSIAQFLPFADGALDVIFAECVLSVFADGACAAHEFVREFARILRPGGCVVASDVYARGRQDDIIAQMESGGLRVLAFEDHTPALKRFAAQLIWEGQSPFSLVGGGQKDGLFCALPPNPGYYLLVAQKDQQGAERFSRRGEALPRPYRPVPTREVIRMETKHG